MGAKILIADDESDIVSMLGSFFESKGFRVLPAFNGAEALKQVEKQPDIILLDINMPGKDGLEVCKRIRDHISCPILFLTARIEDTDKVKGFTVGGDDYIVKPFSLMELEARVRAHLRREARHNFEAQVKFSGDLTIDYSERCLFFGDKRVGLAKREFDIVELLSQNPGQIFDKERIYERIWGYDSEGDSSVVAEHIRRIRTKIAAYIILTSGWSIILLTKLWAIRIWQKTYCKKCFCTLPKIFLKFIEKTVTNLPLISLVVVEAVHTICFVISEKSCWKKYRTHQMVPRCRMMQQSAPTTSNT